jgi:transglutaminase-like putative cysteine protease
MVATARQIAGTARDAQQQVQRIVEWIGAHIRVSPADVRAALDLLRTREADCQGHAYLYAALARALGIPTRLANGIVYSEELGGFRFHIRAESLVDGR